MASIPVEVIVSVKNQASKVLKDLSSDISKQSVDWNSLSLAISGAVAGAGLAITKFTRDASKTEAVRNAFNQMTKGIVGDTDVFIDKMKDASAGTLSNYSILVNANRALSLIGKEAFGEDFTGTFTKAMDRILKSANATGYSVEYLTDSFVLGIGRQSKLILDNLGITTDLTGAYAEYAKTLGKSAEDLTANEQKTASLNHVMDLLDEKYKDVASSSDNFNFQMEALSATWRDIRDEIGEKFLPIATKFMKEFTMPFVKEYGPKMAEALGSLLDKLIQAPRWLKVVLVGLTSIGLIGYPLIKLAGAFKMVWLALLRIVAPLLKFISGTTVLNGVLRIAGDILTFLSKRVLTYFFAGLIKVVGVLASINPVVAIVIGVITALTAVVILAIRHWDKIVEVWNKVYNFISENLIGAFEWLKITVGRVTEAVVSFARSAGNVAIDILTIWLMVLDKISGGLISKLIKIMPDVQISFVALRDTVIEVGRAILIKFTEIGDNAKILGSRISEFVRGVEIDLKDKFNTATDNAHNIWIEFSNNVSARSKIISSDVSSRFNELRNNVVDAWDSMKNGIGGVLDGVINWIKPKIDAIKDWVNNNWASWGISINLPDIGGMLRRWKEGIGGWVGNKINQLPDFLRGLAEQFYFIRGYLPSFDTGGVVPGAIGQPTLAVVHGGETVTPYGQSNGQVSLTVNVGVWAGTSVERRNLANMLWNEIGQIAKSKNKTPQELLGL